jgi:hypothetical protein
MGNNSRFNRVQYLDYIHLEIKTRGNVENDDK